MNGIILRCRRDMYVGYLQLRCCVNTGSDLFTRFVQVNWNSNISSVNNEQLFDMCNYIYSVENKSCRYNDNSIFMVTISNVFKIEIIFI